MDGELLNDARIGLPPGGPEVMLETFLRAGDAGLAGLNGSFCAALHDRHERRLLLVTDRFCSRPIFYCVMDGALAFSTRFNALLAAGLPASPTLDVAALAQLLTWQRVVFTSTLCAQIKAMPPACVLEFADERISMRRYWRICYGGGPRSMADCADALTHALASAARRITADSARRGVLLSGGLDSRLLAAASDAPFTAFTVCDDTNREVRIASRVARAAHWPFRTLPRSQSHYADCMDDAVELTHGMARFDLAQFVGLLDPVPAECDVLLNEDAMDALLKGYYWDRPASFLGLRLPFFSHARITPGPVEEQILQMGAQTVRDPGPGRVALRTVAVAPQGFHPRLLARDDPRRGH